ncbi:MAG: 2-C-methyl-D-erythritol 4-phosphate cytidylyltransferase [Chloroflexota bacterium]
MSATGGVAAVILAAGAGIRMASPVRKVFLPVGGETILARTLAVFEGLASVSTVVLVAGEPDRGHCAEVVARGRFRKVRPLVAGGPTRHDSEANGLASLEASVASGEIGLVLVHDAVRPFVTGEEIDRLIDEARRSGAAILATPEEAVVVTDAGDGWLDGVEPSLWAAQTPQAFDARLALDAHRRAARDGFSGTDTSSVVERTGHPVRVVEGTRGNLKITTPDDLIRAELLAADPRAVGSLAGGARP